MSLKLVLKREETRGGSRRFPSTKQALKEFFASLPEDNTLARLNAIDTALANLAWTNMERDRRFDLLRQYRREMEEMEARFHRHLVGVSLPLSPQAHELCLALRSVFTRLADAYIRILMGEKVNVEKLSRSSIRDQSRACYWALYYLGESLRASYEGYCPTLPRVWTTIHRLYCHARDFQLHERLIRISHPDAEHRTISQTYTKILLLGLSDPYQLPFRTFRNIYDEADKWAPRAKLSSERPHESTNCLFLVDFDLDRPALPMLPRTRVSADDRHLILDTSRLVSYLNAQMDEVISHTLHRYDDEQERFNRFEQLETLRLLIVRWGMHPVRQDERMHVDKKCDLVVGLKSVSLMLQGDATDTQPTRSVKTRASMLKGNLAPAPTASRNQPQLSRNWELSDESTQGIRLLLNDAEQSQVRIGELVAFRDAGDQADWTVGVVRWGQSVAKNQLMIGVYKIGAAPQAAVAQHMATEKLVSGLRSPALAFSDPFTGTQSLICDRGLYRPRTNIWINTRDRRRIVEASDVIISTRCFIWFKTGRAETSVEENLELMSPGQLA